VFAWRSVADASPPALSALRASLSSPSYYPLSWLSCTPTRRLAGGPERHCTRWPSLTGTWCAACARRTRLPLTAGSQVCRLLGAATPRHSVACYFRQRRAVVQALQGVVSADCRPCCGHDDASVPTLQALVRTMDHCQRVQHAGCIVPGVLRPPLPRVQQAIGARVLRAACRSACLQ
jgi:hypothetical protein